MSEIKLSFILSRGAFVTYCKIPCACIMLCFVTMWNVCVRLWVTVFQAHLEADLLTKTSRAFCAACPLHDNYDSYVARGEFTLAV